jgi:hypothetical protein
MPGKPRKRHEKLDWQPITADQLVSILEEAEVWPGEPTPKLKREVTRLAAQLTRTREPYRLNQTFERVNALRAEARGGFEMARGAVDKIPGELRVFLDMAERGSEPAARLSADILQEQINRTFPFLREQIDKTFALLAMVALHGENHPDLKEKANIYAKTWSACLPGLITGLSDIIEMATGRRPGISPDGPLVRVVTMIVPLVTGESPAESTVFRHLRQLRAGGEKDTLPALQAKKIALPV